MVFSEAKIQKMMKNLDRIKFIVYDYKNVCLKEDNMNNLITMTTSSFAFAFTFTSDRCKGDL